MQVSPGHSPQFAPPPSEPLSIFLQAYSPALPVGAQHFYKNSFHALSTIWKAEGLRGMFRGIDAAILRTGMGSSVQLPSYYFTKNALVEKGFSPTSAWTYLMSSSVSGICVVSGC